MLHLALLGLAVNIVPSSARYDVTDYGAVGDGVTDDTKSIGKALAAAAVDSKATVLFPPNKIFLTGPINMTTGLTLQVDGTLKAKSGNNTETGIKGWPQIPPLKNYGNSRDGPYLQYQAFIYAVNVTNIAVTGSGTIDGQVRKHFWRRLQIVNIFGVVYR